MKNSILFIFLFWSVPCLLVYYFPFATNSDLLINVLIKTNIVFYLGIICTYPFFDKVIAVNFSNYGFNVKYLTFLSSLVLFLNLYILINTNFVLGIVDMNIRLEYYNVAGRLWTVLVALYSIIFVQFGCIFAEKRTNRLILFLCFINAIIFILYGMKSGVLQIFLSFFIGYLIGQKRLSKITKGKNFKVSYQFLILTTVLILLGFWIINSLRGGSSLSLYGFALLVYFYIVPPFNNFANILIQSNDYVYPLGGLLGGLYKLFIPGYTDPLMELSNSSLQYATWNVWSYLSSLYVSGGYFELYFGTFCISVLISYSMVLFNKRQTLFSAVLLVEVLSTLIFLHNQYHLASFAPYLSIGIAYVSGKRLKSIN